MDNKSKILLIVLLLLTTASIYLTYTRSFVAKNYEIIPLIPLLEEEEIPEESLE